MKKHQTDVRSLFVKRRRHRKEVAQLTKLQQQSTERSTSNYLRNVPWQKPIIIRYRNATADDFLREMVELKRELSAIGNNYNQAVKKLHLLEKIPEFRAWILINQDLQQQLHVKVSDIQEKVTQLYEQWLQ